jgi:hypothetical protein
MLRFYSEFFKSLGILPQVWPRLNSGIEPEKFSMQSSFGAVKHLADESERLQLPSTLAQCRTIERWVTQDLRRDGGGATFQELGRMFVELYSRALDELEHRHFLVVTLDKVAAYERPLDGWELPIQAFHSSQQDIEEAQRCYALSRSTACVFHLMRALEIPLKVLSAHLDIVKHAPTWNAYLAVMADKIKEKYPDKSKSHADKVMYFSGLEGQLRAIKIAWRNPTMHDIAKVYTPEMAYELIVLVRGFMREAALELCEQ